MFIRSKFKKEEKTNNSGGLRLCNIPVKAHHIAAISTYSSSNRRFHLTFHFKSGESRVEVWSYNSKENRDQEYEWIMKQIGYVANDEIKKMPPSKPPEPIKFFYKVDKYVN